MMTRATREVGDKNGRGNYVILADNLDTNRTIQTRDASAQFAQVRVWPDGTLAVLAGTDCSHPVVCGICGETRCAGCGQEFVIDARDAMAQVICFDCYGDMDLWEFMKLGSLGKLPTSPRPKA